MQMSRWSQRYAPIFESPFCFCFWRLGKKCGRREFKSEQRVARDCRESVISQAQGMFIFIAAVLPSGKGEPK